MSENEDVNGNEERPIIERVAESGYQANKITRRRALHRIGLAAGVLSAAMLLPEFGIGRDSALANLNELPDPAPMLETTSSSSSSSSSKSGQPPGDSYSYCGSCQGSYLPSNGP